MDFFGISPLEILLIMIVALVVLGPERLPSAARTVGRYVNQFRVLSQEVRTQVARELTLEVTDEQGNKVGLDKYIVQMRDEVTGTLQDVKNSLAFETAAVTSAFTVPSTANVISDTITTQVIPNPNSPLDAMSQTHSELPLLTSLDPVPAPRTTHIHILQVPRPQTASSNGLVMDTGIVKEGTTWSEYASANANKIDYSAYADNGSNTSDELNEFEIQLLDDSGQVLSRDVIKLKAGAAGKLTINIAPFSPKKVEPPASDIITNENSLNEFAGSSSYD